MTTQLRSSFLQVLTERGYIHQCTDLEALDAKATQGVVTGYIGFDATADSLHVGNLVSIMLLRRLQQSGHRPIVLMGGGTTKIGDPSGKDEARQLLTNEKIDSNIASLKTIFGNFLSFGSGPKDAIMVNNADWLDGLGYIPFLQNVGRHFTVNRMLTFDSVKLRLEREQPLTFLEFNYMILQGYDFVELHKRHSCALQMGGSDQWGNIVTGTELIRRKDGGEAFALTTHLIKKADGTKFGKTESSNIWLDPARTSPYKFYQFWLNASDEDAKNFIRIFTLKPKEEIESILSEGEILLEDFEYFVQNNPAAYFARLIDMSLKTPPFKKDKDVK